MDTRRPWRLVILALLSVGLFLNLDRCQDQYIERPLTTIAIDSVAISENQCLLRVKAQTPDACWKFARFEVDRKDGEVLIRIIGRREKEALCAQVIGTVEAEVPVEIPHPGKYRFRFMDATEVALDTTVVIP
ncbi:MAG: hypothetical protein D6681_10625 [Calditrichaeota bacterium]|nr:MAG: hypothetical protein D6681_10625 [Calditrichota bacterium]